MLKIYGADLSSPSNKVRFVANMIGLEYDYKQISIRDGENRKEEFLRLNPAGKVPAIDDDGLTLFESGAIVKYLCDKHHSDLYPQDLNQRAIINQWDDFVVIHVLGAISRVLFNRLFAPMINIEVDERSLSDGLKFLDKFLPVINTQLANSSYLAGQNLSLADITLLASLDPCEVAQIDLSPYGSIVKWRNALKQNDFYTKCHKDYGDVLKQMTG